MGAEYSVHTIKTVATCSLNKTTAQSKKAEGSTTSVNLLALDVIRRKQNDTKHTFNSDGNEWNITLFMAHTVQVCTTKDMECESGVIQLARIHTLYTVTSIIDIPVERHGNLCSMMQLKSSSSSPSSVMNSNDKSSQYCSSGLSCTDYLLYRQI